jgi:large subunit ribosomal protein L10
MALTRQQKEAQLTDIEQRWKKASSVMFAHYIGLSVTDITKLRLNLRKEQAEMKVAKKSLLKIAMKKLNVPEVKDEDLSGPVACIFSMGEPTSGANITFKFGKDHAQVKLIGGVFSGKLLSPAESVEFATIPSRPVLLGIFMSMCNAPLTQFASACSSPLSGFARCLSEIAKKRAAEVPAAPAAAPVSPAAPVPQA